MLKSAQLLEEEDEVDAAAVVGRAGAGVGSEGGVGVAVAAVAGRGCAGVGVGVGVVAAELGATGGAAGLGRDPELGAGRRLAGTSASGIFSA